MAFALRLGLGLVARVRSAFAGNPVSEAINDESSNGLTDESGNGLFDSGA